MSWDNELHSHVVDELEWDTDLDASHITVSVKEGIVTLTGYVSSYIHKKNAERAAKRVKGVQAVVDDIELKLPGSGYRTDLEITETALSMLRYNALIPKDKIKLVVDNGWITLDGEVDWQSQKIAAENALKYMVGIKGITNNVIVKPAIRVSEIKSRIQSALTRNAQLDANQITVSTVDSTIILGGYVRSLAEKDQAEKAAWSAPGVSKIENNIVCRYLLR
jgi:osmotically-inducible protein OsmY